ncbi:Membrane protein involved in the export of O-antigen and teichoic acid [Tistlia consotensis]|uniref:Membrane protein involved in the export of O-antigen and teichoic acid n=1 Tax=Tistlia consotensis USBA 355 TaxID=560819 RepID=A0A1Y6BR00_9PROT|nr:hypothetical protein [Tistlia consotensis]SMF21016.1 Membrane protein involved in the export of O-antigen and teichoic acid [Tistlia consotensis USBA 355]SNR47278.1 Membrane protein involved in the export of O-antigen and teichoic acid [Tistlia consotensis]
MIPLPARATLRRWSVTGLSALADQVVFSSVNFLLNILLARFLTAEAYGAFAIAYSLFFLALSPYQALVIEPFHALGGAPDRPGGAGYLSQVLQGQLLLALVLAGVLVVAGLALGAFGSPVGPLLLLFAAAAPFLFLQMLLRRACYVEGRAGLALAGSSVYFLVACAGVLLLVRFGEAGATAVPPLLGLAGAAGLAVPVLGLGIPLRRLLSLDGGRLRAVALEHWRHGRWLLASGALGVVSGTIYAPAIGAALGTAQAGAFRAVQNLFLPLTQMLAALAMPLLPVLSRKLGAEGEGGDGPQVRRAVLLLLPVAAGLVLPYALAMLLVGDRLLDLLYGAGKYTGDAWLLDYLSVGALGLIAVFALGQTARALRRFSIVSAGEAAGALATVCVTLPLLGLYGLAGAAAGFLVAQLAPAVVLSCWAVRRLGRRRGSGG